MAKSRGAQSLRQSIAAKASAQGHEPHRGPENPSCPQEGEASAVQPSDDATQPGQADPSPQRQKGKRIAVVCHAVEPCGGLLRFKRFGEHIARKGHHLAFVHVGPDAGSLKIDNLEILTLKQAAGMEWDATFIPGAGFPESTIETFAKLKRPNFGLRVQHILNDKSKRQRFLLVNRSFRPDLVIFNNRHWEPGSYTDFVAKQFHVLAGAVDLDLFKPAPGRKYADEKQTISIGGLANKNPWPTIHAVLSLPDNFTLHLYGGGDKPIRERFPGAISIGKIRLHGPLDENGLIDFYRNMDIVIHTETFAGWANVAAEAVACGVPLICTAHGTLDFARHEETALLLGTPPQAEAIAADIQRLHNEKGLAKRLALRGVKAIQPFGLAEYSDALLALLEERPEPHYCHAPEIGLYGKWPLETRIGDLEPLWPFCEGASVLDLGAAEGLVAHASLSHGVQLLHGFELEPDRVRRAKKICSKFPAASFRSGNLATWDSFAKSHEDLLLAKYDIVLYLGLHHHLPKGTRLDTLRQACRRANHIFALRTPDRLFSEEGLAELLREEGFEELHQANEHTDVRKGAPRIYKRVAGGHSEPKSRPGSIRREFISYPKSGRSWVRYALHSMDLANGIRFHHDGFEFNNGAKPPHNFDLQARRARCARADKIVYLTRDPRDIMVSLYFQITGRFKDFFNYQGSISDFIRDPWFGAHNLREFQRQWGILGREAGNVLTISYEGCHKDMERVLRRVADHFELSCTEAEIRQAVEASSFERMKRVEKSENFDFPWLRPRNQATKVRKGRVGGYADTLPPEDIDYLNEVFGL